MLLSAGHKEDHDVFYSEKDKRLGFKPKSFRLHNTVWELHESLGNNYWKRVNWCRILLPRLHDLYMVSWPDMLSNSPKCDNSEGSCHTHKLATYNYQLGCQFWANHNTVDPYFYLYSDTFREPTVVGICIHADSEWVYSPICTIIFLLHRHNVEYMTITLIIVILHASSVHWQLTNFHCHKRVAVLSCQHWSS